MAVCRSVSIVWLRTALVCHRALHWRVNRTANRYIPLIWVAHHSTVLFVCEFVSVGFRFVSFLLSRCHRVLRYTSKGNFTCAQFDLVPVLTKSVLDWEFLVKNSYAEIQANVTDAESQRGLAWSRHSTVTITSWRPPGSQWERWKAVMCASGCDLRLQ